MSLAQKAKFMRLLFKLPIRLVI